MGTNAPNPEGPTVPGVDAAAQEERVSPQVESLRAMFPDFDVTVLQSVLDSVNNDQERALDVLLGMSDPEYVSTTEPVQHVQPSLDLDEQLARQLMLEDQQQQQQRQASGQSWPRRSEGDVPYQARRQPGSPPAPNNGGEQSDQFQELQRTMGQIAESGKRTFSSIVSRVKAKINEYEQSRSSSASAPPQWGSAPPANLDRHTASEAYQQQYFGSAVPAQPTRSAVHDPADLHGYDPPAISLPIPTTATQQSTTGLGLSASPSTPPSSDIPRPPPTSSGSPVNPAKIGLLPKRPVSLLNTNSPPATRPSDEDDDLEYVENPFEEHK
ncbi:hypothetical protein BD309DRAFT_988189 [Dichomitus squalens]|uniref:Uncharacterized protein n=1 Tax=Dichomitus squalens TaxID=114155 RepID=A0A4Q9P2H9_9APHY|nr:hypothetical protein BD309DRAFT_988189 [Dichomitus squalens]TBU64456.1 hypothetical protein BD310DRAFT_1009517 [Dichomitus squalens]